MSFDDDEFEQLPEKVACALLAWRTKSAERGLTYNKLFLKFKAAMAGERRISIKEIEAMVGADADYYNACLAEITAESEYTALYERLMVMKKMAQMRAAF